MIEAIIIEDEPPAAQRLQKLINETAPDIKVEHTLDSIESSVRRFQQNPLPSLIFLDIQLADGLSFEIFKHIKIDSFIIFTTAYDMYAIKAFELNSIDYLLKPVSKSALLRAIDKFRLMQGKIHFDVNELIDIIENRKSVFKSRFVINVGSKIRTVDTSEIAYFCSLEKSTFLYTFKEKNYPLDFSLDNLESMVNPEIFFRINRQYLVNYTAIAGISVLSKSRIRLDLTPAVKDDIFVSNARTPGFRRWLDK